MSRQRTLTLLLVAPLAALTLTACGSDSDTSSPSDTAAASDTAAPDTAAPDTASVDDTAPDTASPDASTPGANATAVTLADSSLGRILADGDGRTLYLFTKDSPTTSACTADCVGSWPAFASDGVPSLAVGLDAADFGMIAGADDAQQVTFYGHPLYYFAGDQNPGDTNGQGIGSVWFVVDADGNPVS